LVDDSSPCPEVVELECEAGEKKQCLLQLLIGQVIDALSRLYSADRI
jgi:hypothetical protein